MKYFKIVDAAGAQNFDSHAKDGSAIVKYYAPWCGHCKNLRPKWNSSCKRHGIDVDIDEMKEVYYNNENNDSFILAEASDDGIPHMKSYNNVDGFPTIAHLENGKMVKLYDGPHEENALHEWMGSIMGGAKMGGAKIGGSKKRKNTKNKTQIKKTNKRKTQKREVSHCPHMPPHNGKHLRATKKHVMKINNKNYHVKTCCHACGIVMKSTLKLDPKSFHKNYVAKKEKNYLLLKNKHSGKSVQKAHLVKKLTRKTKKSKLSGGSTTTGFGIGPLKFSKKTGNKSWKYNSKGKLEAHDKDCYKLNGIGACKIKDEKSEKPWYSFW